MDQPHQRLRHARAEQGFDTAAAAADAFGWNRNTYASNENGNAPFSYRRAKDYAVAFAVRPEWLYDASGPMRALGLARVIGMWVPTPPAKSSMPRARNPRTSPPSRRAAPTTPWHSRSPEDPCADWPMTGP